jgi:hypothetical protein
VTKDKTVEKLCEFCRRERPKRASQRFCSRTCAVSAQHSGPIWLGVKGRWWLTTRSGAPMTFARALMECHLGRHLEAHEVVNHVNGDKTDDRVENLQVLSKSAHATLHKNTPRKLTEGVVRAIRESPLPGVALAEVYGVRPETVYRVRRGVTWAWVQ